MYIVNGIMYAKNTDEPIRIQSVKPLKDRMMIVTFQSGETRLFDSECLKGPAFERLDDELVFEHPIIDHGIVTWDNGDIDCSSEFIYKNSYEYTPISAESDMLCAN